MSRGGGEVAHNVSMDEGGESTPKRRVGNGPIFDETEFEPNMTERP